MSSGSGNYHLPTSTTAQQTHQSQRFNFLSKLRKQHKQQQVVVVPTTTTMLACGSNSSSSSSGEPGEARATSCENNNNNNNNNNNFGHSNGLPPPLSTTSQRQKQQQQQQRQHSPSMCTDSNGGNHYYSQSMPIASQPSRPQRSSRGAAVASSGQHSIAYAAGEYSPPPQLQPVAPSPASRRTEVASYTARSQQQVYAPGAMSHGTNGITGHHYDQQQRSNQQHQQQHCQQHLQSQQFTQNSNLNGGKGRGRGDYFLEKNPNTVTMRAPVNSGNNSSDYLGARYQGGEAEQTLACIEDEEEDHHYAEQLRRAQMQQQKGPASSKEQQRGQQQQSNNTSNNHLRQYSDQQQQQHNNHRLHPTSSLASTADKQQQQLLATGDNTTKQRQQQQQHSAHSPRESLHVNFNRSSSQRSGQPGEDGDDEEGGGAGGESTRKKKYLTAKYGQQQMNLIKKRLKIEMWLHEQLQQLAAHSKSPVDPEELDEIDIDLDQLLDMEDDVTRRHWLVKTLKPMGELPQDAMEKFICDVLEQSKLL